MMRPSQSVLLYSDDLFVILFLQIITVRVFNVFLKLPEGRTLSVQVKNIGTVKEIKEHVREVEGLAIDKQIVKV